MEHINQSLDNNGNMVRIENAIKTGLDNNLENNLKKTQSTQNQSLKSHSYMKMN